MKLVRIYGLFLSRQYVSSRTPKLDRELKQQKIALKLLENEADNRRFIVSRGDFVMNAMALRAFKV